MRKLLTALIAATALSVTLPAARADVVLLNGSILGSFTDVGAQGFGAAPRLLTEQGGGQDNYLQGLVRPDALGALAFPQVFPNNAAPNFDVNFGNFAIDNGQFKGSIATINQLGWQSGSNVSIAFNTDQQGNTGITLQKMTIGLFGPIGGGIDLLQTFSTATPINFSAADLALQQGNGTSAFLFVLDPAQRALWDAIVAAHPGDNLIIGLAAILGCGPNAGAGCLPTNDGPDSFRALVGPGGVSEVPLPAAAWLFASGLGGLAWLARRKKKQQQPIEQTAAA